MPSRSLLDGPLLCPPQALVNDQIRRLIDEPADDQEQLAERYWRLLIRWEEATPRNTLVTAA